MRMEEHAVLAMIAELDKRLDRLESPRRPSMFVARVDRAISEDARKALTETWWRFTDGTELEGSRLFIIDDNVQIDEVFGETLLRDAGEYLRSIGREDIAEQLEGVTAP